MHNHIFRKIDAARLCEQKLGLAAGTIVSVDADNDGMVDGELVILHSDDLATLQSGGVASDTVYFGDLIIEGYEASGVVIQTDAGGARSCNINYSSSKLPVGNQINCLMFDNVADYAGASAHFYGWKFSYGS